jgi:hypothetical protein
MNHTILAYSPSDFSKMETLSDPTKQAMAERALGIFTPLEITAEAFRAAYDTPDIGPHIEKDYKGLSYLSWPFAFRYLKEHFPTLFVAFEEKTIGWPVFGEPGAFILRPYLTDGIRRTPALVFPVMDRKHLSIQQLDGRAISDNIQRASVKAIATFTGLGLRLYAGEDIPKEDDKATTRTQTAAKESAAAPGSKGPSASANTGSAELFDAKTVLTTVCKANPLNYADEKAAMAAGKAALESIGLARATEVKSWKAFGNVVASMMTLWAKQQEVVITKAEMTEEINLVCGLEDTTAIIEGMKAFVAKKQ